MPLKLASNKNYQGGAGLHVARPGYGPIPRATQSPARSQEIEVPSSSSTAVDINYYKSKGYTVSTDANGNTVLKAPAEYYPTRYYTSVGDRTVQGWIQRNNISSDIAEQILSKYGRNIGIQSYSSYNPEVITIDKAGNVSRAVYKLYTPDASSRNSSKEPYLYSQDGTVVHEAVTNRSHGEQTLRAPEQAARLKDKMAAKEYKERETARKVQELESTGAPLPDDYGSLSDAEKLEYLTRHAKPEEVERITGKKSTYLISYKGKTYPTADSGFRPEEYKKDMAAQGVTERVISKDSEGFVTKEQTRETRTGPSGIALPFYVMPVLKSPVHKEIVSSETYATSFSDSLPRGIDIIDTAVAVGKGFRKVEAFPGEVTGVTQFLEDFRDEQRQESIKDVQNYISNGATDISSNFSNTIPKNMKSSENQSSIEKMFTPSASNILSYENHIDEPKGDYKTYDETHGVLTTPLPNKYLSLAEGVGHGALFGISGIAASFTKHPVEDMALAWIGGKAVSFVGKSAASGLAKVFPSISNAVQGVIAKGIAVAAIGGVTAYHVASTPKEERITVLSGDIGAGLGIVGLYKAGELAYSFGAVPLQKTFHPNYVKTEIELKPVTTDPIQKRELITKFGNKEVVTVHVSESPSLSVLDSEGKIQLVANPEMAKGFRKSQDLLHFYRSLPTDQGKPQAYLAYLSDITATDNSPTSFSTRFTLFSPKKRLLVEKTNVQYIKPKPGESTLDYAERTGVMSGVTMLAAENLLGGSIERQAVTPAAFTGVRGTKYPGSVVEKVKDVGFTFFRQGTKTTKLHITEVKTSPVDEILAEVPRIDSEAYSSGYGSTKYVSPSSAAKEAISSPIMALSNIFPGSASISRPQSQSSTKNAMRSISPYSQVQSSPSKRISSAASPSRRQPYDDLSIIRSSLNKKSSSSKIISSIYSPPSSPSRSPRYSPPSSPPSYFPPSSPPSAPPSSPPSRPPRSPQIYSPPSVPPAYIPPYSPPRGPPKSPPQYPPSARRKTTSNLVEGFIPLVKREGKWRPLSGKAFSEAEAMFKGAQFAQRTPGASFKIAPAGRPAPQRRASQQWRNQFYERQTKAGKTFIERTKYRINALEEFQGITAKGIAAPKRRRR